MNRYKIYDDIYGEIPEDFEERIKYILNTRNPELVVKTVEDARKKINKIKKKTTKFTVYIEPKPSARPRITTLGAYPRFYVPNARMNKTNFESFFKSHGDLPYINTPMEYNLKVYMKTPSSLNKVQTLLAEIGVLRPWNRSGDVDNLFKAYTDWCIGSLIEDDSLITDAVIQKFYSIKPRIEIEISYLESFPNTDVKVPKINKTKKKGK